MSEGQLPVNFGLSRDWEVKIDRPLVVCCRCKKEARWCAYIEVYDAQDKPELKPICGLCLKKPFRMEGMRIQHIVTK